jgi:hypothetical protein
MAESIKKFRESINKTIADINSNRKKQIKLHILEENNLKREQEKLLLEMKMQKDIVKKKAMFQSVVNKNELFTPAVESIDLADPFVKESTKILIASTEKSTDFTNDWKHNSLKLTFFDKSIRCKSQFRNYDELLKHSETAGMIPKKRIVEKAGTWCPNEFHGKYFKKFDMDINDKYIDTKTRFNAIASSRVNEKKLWKK